jgi:hypothetical protein
MHVRQNWRFMVCAMFPTLHDGTVPCYRSVMTDNEPRTAAATERRRQQGQETKAAALRDAGWVVIPPPELRNPLSLTITDQSGAVLYDSDEAQPNTSTLTVTWDEHGVAHLDLPGTDEAKTG